LPYDATQQNLILLRKIYAEKARRTIFFLGAGASAESGLPTWYELRENLHAIIHAKVTPDSDEEEMDNFRELEERKDNNDYWSYFDHAERKWPTTYNDFLENAFDIDVDNIDIPIVYKKIWDMNGVGQVLTLNVDGLLSYAFNDTERTKNNTLLQYDGYSVTDCKTYFSRGSYCLLNLHGTIFQKSRWIMNESERRRLYEGESKEKYRSFLTWIYQTHNVVFVGMNPRDIAVSQFIQLASETGLLGKHFWICPSPTSENKRWAEQNGVRIIEYQPLDGEDGAKVHSTDICAILDDLEKFISIDPPVDLPTTTPPLDPTILDEPQNLVTLLSNDRHGAIQKMSSAATFIGENYGFSSVQMDNLIRDFSLPIQISTSLDTKMPPYNEILNYKLIDKIQTGGSSSVWLCEDSNKKGEYFIAKTLAGSSHEDATERQSFRRGIESMYLLSNADLNVSPYYIFHLELPLTVIMEHVSGDNLSKIVAGKQLQNGINKLMIFEKICRTIRECHLSPGNVLHRDIKPGNIIFKDWYSGYDSEALFDSDVRLINFDLSWHKYSSGNTKAISADEVGYYAPEQKGSKNSAPPRTAKTDVYMLGMILYFLISEENPPEGGARLYDWKEIVLSRVNRSFDQEIIKKRVTRLILSMTEIDVDKRTDAEAALGEIRNIFEFLNANYDSVDHDFLVENLMAQVGRDYHWDSGKMQGVFQTVANANFSVKYLPRGMKCEINFDRSRDEGSNRATFGKRINERIQESRQTLIDAGWECEIGGGTIRHLKAHIPVRILSEKPDLGINSMVSIANRLLSSID